MSAIINKIVILCFALIFSIGFVMATDLDTDFDTVPDCHDDISGNCDECPETSPLVNDVDVQGCPLDLGQPTTETDLPILEECGEGDNGVDYYSAGTTRTTSEEETDYCVENTLFEFYCLDGSINETSIECESGCNEGACNTCRDGTLYNECSSTKPLHCQDGQLVDKASSCGCPSGQIAEGDNCITSQPISTEECILTNAEWNITEAVERDIVRLTVTGNNCDTEQISFIVKENDVIGDDPIRIDPESTIFFDGEAITSWTAEWQNDLIGDPEYYFIAILDSNPNIIILSSGNDLRVNPTPADDLDDTDFGFGTYSAGDYSN